MIMRCFVNTPMSPTRPLFITYVYFMGSQDQAVSSHPTRRPTINTQLTARGHSVTYGTIGQSYKF